MIDRWSTPVWKFADGHIETLARVPVGQAPFAESDLRDLLAQNASLLPVKHFDPVFAAPSACSFRSVAVYCDDRTTGS